MFVVFYLWWTKFTQTFCCIYIYYEVEHETHWNILLSELYWMVFILLYTHAIRHGAQAEWRIKIIYVRINLRLYYAASSRVRSIRMDNTKPTTTIWLNVRFGFLASEYFAFAEWAKRQTRIRERQRRMQSADWFLY